MGIYSRAGSSPALGTKITEMFEPVLVLPKGLLRRSPALGAKRVNNLECTIYNEFILNIHCKFLIVNYKGLLAQLVRASA